MTELATTESSAAHDKAGSTKDDVHDSAAPRCVAIEEAKRVLQTRPSAHEKPWVRTTEVR